MEARSFAGFNPRPSAWGYNWITDNISSTDYRSSPANHSSQNSPVSTTSTSSPEPQMLSNQYANLPAALLTSLKKDKKPFTYTPGGVNLSEVMNARLQKRLERKKKYCEDRMASYDQNSNPVETLPKFESPRQLIVMPTYNTPLDMYSMENALEALEVQAELVAGDKSFSSPSRSATLPRNHRFDDYDLDSNRVVAQSKAFKVLQIITDTDEESYVKGKGGHHQDEMRFTGIRDSKAIPSKFFHTLQKITGTEGDEEEENDSRQMKQEPKPAVNVKQQTRPGFLPQPKQYLGASSPPQNAGMQHHVRQFQPMSNNRVIQESNNPCLKRPAAFLPMKTGGVDPMSRIKPVHPQFFANGPRKVFNPSGGTDF